jgi:excisionase family DNA binding protein
MRTSWGDLVRAKLGMTKGDVFSVPDAAELLGISDATLRGMVRSGNCSATDVRLDGKALWRLTRADILAYVDKVEARA